MPRLRLPIAVHRLPLCFLRRRGWACTPQAISASGVSCNVIYFCRRSVSLSEIANAFASMGNNLEGVNTTKIVPQTIHSAPISRTKESEPKKESSSIDPENSSPLTSTAASRSRLPFSPSSLLGPLSEDYAFKLRYSFMVEEESPHAIADAEKATETLFFSEIESNLRKLQYSAMMVTVLEVLSRWCFTEKKKEESRLKYQDEDGADRAEDSTSNRSIGCVLSDRVLEVTLMCLIKLPDLPSLEREVTGWLAQGTEGCSSERLDALNSKRERAVVHSSQRSVVSPAKLYAPLLRGDWGLERAEARACTNDSGIIQRVLTAYLLWLEQRVSFFSPFDSVRILHLLAQQPYFVSTPILGTLVDNFLIHPVAVNDLGSEAPVTPSSEGEDHSSPRLRHPRDRRFRSLKRPASEASGIAKVCGVIDDGESYANPTLYSMLLDTMLRHQQYSQSVVLWAPYFGHSSEEPFEATAQPLLLEWGSDVVHEWLHGGATGPSTTREAGRPRYRSEEQYPKELKGTSDALPPAASLSLAPVVVDSTTMFSSPVVQEAVYNHVVSELHRRVKGSSADEVIAAGSTQSKGRGTFTLTDMEPASFFFLTRSLSRLIFFNDYTIRLLRDVFIPSTAHILQHRPEQYTSLLFLFGRKENPVVSSEAWSLLLRVMEERFQAARDRKEVASRLTNENPFHGTNPHTSPLTEQQPLHTEVPLSCAEVDANPTVLPENPFALLGVEVEEGFDNALLSNGEKSEAVVEQTEPDGASCPENASFSTYRYPFSLGVSSVPLTLAMLGSMVHIHRLVVPHSMESTLIRLLEKESRQKASDAFEEKNASHRPPPTDGPDALSSDCGLTFSTVETQTLETVRLLRRSLWLLLEDLHFGFPSYLGSLYRSAAARNTSNSTVSSLFNLTLPLSFEKRLEADSMEMPAPFQSSPGTLFFLLLYAHHLVVVQPVAHQSAPLLKKDASCFLEQVLWSDTVAAPSQAIGYLYNMLWISYRHHQLSGRLCRTVQSILAQLLSSGTDLLGKNMSQAFAKGASEASEGVWEAEGGGEHKEGPCSTVWYYHPLIVELTLLWTQLLPFALLSSPTSAHASSLSFFARFSTLKARLSRQSLLYSPSQAVQIQELVDQLVSLELLMPVSCGEGSKKRGSKRVYQSTLGSHPDKHQSDAEDLLLVVPKKLWLQSPIFNSYRLKEKQRNATKASSLPLFYRQEAHADFVLFSMVLQKMRVERERS